MNNKIVVIHTPMFPPEQFEIAVDGITKLFEKTEFIPIVINTENKFSVEIIKDPNLTKDE